MVVVLYHNIINFFPLALLRFSITVISKQKNQMQNKDNEDNNHTNNRITWGDGYDLKFEIVKSILYRETKLENLRVLTRPYRSTGMTDETVKKARTLIEEVRDATVDVVEKIMYWSLRFVKKTSFVWHSQNYLLLVLNSMNFLDRCFLDSKFKRNPLVRKRSRLRGEDPIDTSSKSTDEKKMEDKLDLCELLLVEEENLCEPIPDRFRCDWCSRVEESLQVLCFRRDCRSRFCDRCIDANSKLAGSYEKACRAKSWKCFLCVEKIKQISRTWCCGVRARSPKMFIIFLKNNEYHHSPRVLKNMFNHPMLQIL